MNDSYNDIEKLLSHESLGAFEYQTFKKAPVAVSEMPSPEVFEPRVAHAPPIEKAEIIRFPDLARAGGRQQGLVTSKSALVNAHVEAVALGKPSEGIREMFQRLTRTVPAAAPSPVVLDLHLPERPMIAAESSIRLRFSQLPVDDAFAGLLAASAGNESSAHPTPFSWASAS